MWPANEIDLWMKTIFGNHRQSRSLPQVKGEDSQTCPDSRACRAFGQHSTETELTFQHTDRPFDAAAKALQLPEPRLSLMRFLCFAQAAHFRDADFFKTGLAKFLEVIGAVVAPIGGEFLRLYAQPGFCLAHQRKQFRAIVGMAPVNLIVNDDSGAILHQLQRAPKLHRLVQFPFANGPHLRIVKRDDALRDRLLALKLVLGLAENGLGQFDLFKKLLLELGRVIRCRILKRSQGLVTLLYSVFCKLGHFVKDLSSFLFALPGVCLGRLTPAEKGPLGCSHVASDLSTQTSRCAGKGLYRLVNDPDIVGVADVSLKGGGINPNPPRLYRTSLQQLLDQMFVKIGDTSFAKSLIELDQGGGVGDLIHQGKPTEIPPGQSLLDFPLNFFIAQAPTKFQVHHSKIDPHRGARAPQVRIEILFKGFQQLRVGQKLVDLLEFFVQLIETRIDKTVTKTHLLRYRSAHDLFLYITAPFDPRQL